MSETAEELCARLSAIPTPNIGDAMERLGVLHSSIKPIWPGARLVGPAFTVWTRAGDNAVLHRAVAEAASGDVIVVNGQGDETRALMGELIGARARNAGIAGFVIDGAARDADGLMKLGVPVFARTTCAAGPYKHGPGLLECPVAVGGVAVLPGDIVVADEEGVVIIPRSRAETVVAEAEAIQQGEARKMEAILADGGRNSEVDPCAAQ